LPQNARKDNNKKLVTVLKEKNFIERMVLICFAKHCSSGKRAEHLLTVVEKAKKRFPVVYN
jgi:hypothetical protein